MKVKEYQDKINELTVALGRSTERITALQIELNDIHNLLTVFGVVDKVEYKESWKSGNLSASTRFALYVAGKLNA